MIGNLFHDIKNYQNISLKDFNKKLIGKKFQKVFSEFSESFIVRFYHNVDWGMISVNNRLTLKFVEKFQDKVNWDYISRFQKLTEKKSFKIR